MCVFITAIIIFDLIGVLSYFKLVKGIKWPKRKKFRHYDDSSSDSEPEEEVIYATEKPKNTYGFVYKDINERARHIYRATEMLGVHRFNRPPNKGVRPADPVKELPSNPVNKPTITNTHKTNQVFKLLAADAQFRTDQAEPVSSMASEVKRKIPTNAVMASKPVYPVKKMPEAISPRNSVPKLQKLAAKPKLKPIDSFDSDLTFDQVGSSTSFSNVAKPNTASELVSASTPSFSTDPYSDFITYNMPAKNSYKARLQARRNQHRQSLSSDKRKSSGREVDIATNNRMSLID